MRQNRLRTVVAMSAGLVVLMAAAVSAHGTVREIRSTWVTLERAAAVVRQVMTAGPLQQATSATPPAAPPAPAAPRATAPPRAAQTPRAPVPPASVTPPTRPEPPLASDSFDRNLPDGVFDRRRTQPIIRIGQGYAVGPSDEVSDVVIVGGSLRVEGRVRGDVVVVMGTVHLAGTAIVDGDFVNVAGGVTVLPGARVHGDMVTVGGAFNGPAGFAPAGEQVVVGSDQIGQRIEAFIPWVTRGLLWGRLIVPSLPWVWVVVGVTFLISLLLGVLFEPAVRSSAVVVSAKPLTSFLIGVLVLLLLGPVAVILAVSVVGIIVLPFLFCALLIGGLIGKIAVARWLGFSIVPEGEEGGRLAAARSVAIGLLIIMLAYMVPVLGIVTWVLVGVLGLGGATSALFKALRRENPSSPRPPKAPKPVPPVDQSPASDPSLASSVLAPPMAYVAEPSAPPTAEAPMPTVSPGMSYAQATEPGGADLLALPRATLLQRVAAGALDVFLVAIIFSMLDVHWNVPFWFLALLTAYNAAFWTWRGTTIGGVILQLRVARLDGRPLVFGDSVVRGLSSVFSLLAFGIGFLWIGLNSNLDRQAWHDLIAGTVVVRVPRSMPLR